MKWHGEVSTTIAREYEVEANSQDEALLKLEDKFIAELSTLDLPTCLIEGLELDDIWED